MFCATHVKLNSWLIRRHEETDVAVSVGGGGIVTFGWGGQPVASRCSCSEVWLEKRSEQQAVRPSLFIREEMIIQPQPHIDLLISSPNVLGLKGEWRGGKKRAAATSWSLPYFLSPHSWCLFYNVFHMVLIHRYSVTQIRMVSSTVNTTQMLMLTLIHIEGTCIEVQVVSPFPSWLLSTYSTPSDVLLSLNSTRLLLELPVWKIPSHPQDTFLWHCK